MAKSETPARAFRLLRDGVAKFDLSLQGLIVLTEAASGNYIFTPLIAALAGADKVHAVTRDSRYASAKQVMESTYLLANYLGVADRLEIHTTLAPSIIREADIVTNLGFVRPINKVFISHMKESAVIPLMFETWEFRKEDVDLKECRRKGICVLGTNEEDTRLRTFGYLGHLVSKKLFEIGIEIFRSKIAVIGTSEFGANITNTLNALGAHVVSFFIEKTDSLQESHAVWENFKGCDAMIVTAHCSPELIVGTKGYVSPLTLKEWCPDVVIIHLSGRIDRAELDKSGISYLPDNEPGDGYMSWPLSELGPRPVIDLNSAGLKVGELMARARLRGLKREEAEKEVLLNPICQDFGEEQKI